MIFQTIQAKAKIVRVFYCKLNWYDEKVREKAINKSSLNGFLLAHFREER